MEAMLIGLENWPIAEYFRNSRWGYAFLNATHIFGVALLVGATVAMNLRLLGCWPNVPLTHVIRVLVPIAVGGLTLALLAGSLLFSVRALEYASLGFFKLKLLLVLIGSVSAVYLHWAFRLFSGKLTNRRRIIHAIVSLICWPGALVFGRLIAFADN